MMHSGRRPAGSLAGIFPASLTLVWAMTGISSAGAATPKATGCENWTGTQPADPGTDNTFASVAVLAACDAWAVGFSVSGGMLNTLIKRWNGHAWTVVPSPGPRTDSRLRSVRARSPR